MTKRNYRFRRKYRRRDACYQVRKSVVKRERKTVQREIATLFYNRLPRDHMSSIMPLLPLLLGYRLLVSILKHLPELLLYLS